jgi:asparagine synthase (glutamine-hydrolysing)
MVSDVEIGTFMSGGIDSSTVSVIASKYKKNLKTLSLGFHGFSDLNEISQAKDTAALHNLKHSISYANPSEVLKSLQEVSVAYEEPYYHLSANFILAKMASKNKLKVVLSGLGGDELFGGYDVYKKLPLWLQLKQKKNLVNILPNVHSLIKKGKQIANYTSIEEFYSHYYQNYNDHQINKLFNTSNCSSKNTIANLYKGNAVFTDHFEAISYYNIKSYIGNHQMRAVDRSTMAFSIEGRFPLLDHTFIEAAFKIPTKLKIKNNTQKYVLRQIAKNYISKSSLDMRKKGLSLPLKNWLSKELKEFTYDHILGLKNRTIFNNKEIDSLLEQQDETKIWQLVSTELWLKNFL